MPSSVFHGFSGLLGVFFLSVFCVAPAGAGTLQWQEGDGFRSATLPIPLQGKTGFTKMTGSITGIVATNFLRMDLAVTNSIYQNGSGVAAGDVDGDGLCDLYFARLEGGGALYRNLGNWHFQDITAQSGAACTKLSATGVALADLDGNGDLDLIVNSIGKGVSTLLNDGKGHFLETASPELKSPRGGSSLALGDVDGDGDLDLYVENYRSSTLRDEPDTRFRMLKEPNGRTIVTMVDGRPTTDPDLVGRFTYNPTTGITEHGEPDSLFLNDGTGKFSAVPWQGGAFRDEDGAPSKTPYDWGLSVMMRDLNGDGAPDIYVCNDFFSPDRIWINDGQGHFRAIARTAIRKTSVFSMGVDFGDINRDGHDDFIVMDMLPRNHANRMVQAGMTASINRGKLDLPGRPQNLMNTVGLGRGDGTFAEIAFYAGLESSDWSWTPILLDVDLDGYEDLLVSNGFFADSQNMDVGEKLEALKAQKKLTRQEKLDLRRSTPKLETPNCAFRNKRDLTFEEVGKSWGFDSKTVSQGMILADLDNDGDMDVIVATLNSEPELFRNDTTLPRVAVRLKGKPKNTAGIGAKIWVTPNEPASPLPAQSQEIICGGRYLSSDEAMRMFAARQSQSMTIRVVWRGGSTSMVTNATPNRVYEIAEAGALGTPPPSRNSPPPQFEDASELLNHTHFEEPFNDFEREPLLPRSLSGLGPGVAWLDLNGDGWEDLVIGSGKGGRAAFFLNDGKGGFSPWLAAPLDQVTPGDQTGLVGWSAANGSSTLFIGLSSYQEGVTNGVGRFEINGAGITPGEGLPSGSSSVGPLSLADIDGDGDLDLFVGGRVIPGRFPQAADSHLFRNESGRFQPDKEGDLLLDPLGMASGAVFSDLDADGFPELLVATDWGGIHIFWNKKGKLSEDPLKPSLSKWRGCWNGITTGDFDGDGRLDILASNLGRNTKYQATIAGEARLFYTAVESGGGMALFEAYQDAESKKLYPLRDWKPMMAAFPFLIERFSSHQEYGSSSLAEMFREKLKSFGELRLNMLETTLFLNRGDHFESLPLPAEAQFAPAFGVNAGDLDGDGNEDIFLGQNFFGVELSIPRQDAGRGLWLRGDGAGRFTTVPGQESGILVYGEQRGTALCDYDGDGRVDIAVAQNSARTRLLHNRLAKPGLRVRLEGPPGNALGVGAILRVGNESKLGPAREVHAGSGYWSQDSAVQVISAPAGANQIEVHWPGGKTTRSTLPVPALEVRIRLDGSVTKLR